MLEKAKNGIEKSIHHLKVEFSKLQVGRANPAMIEDIRIESYGSLVAIKNIASISVVDPQTLSIQPWDKSQVHPIAKAITEAGIGLNPMIVTDSILIKFPPLTEERRKELCKVAKRISEDAKISIRNARQEALKDIKASKDAKEITEDDARNLEKELQKMVDEANKNIDLYLKKKEEDIMKL